MIWVEPEAAVYAEALSNHRDADVYHDPHYLRSVAVDGEARVLVMPNVVLPIVVRPLPAWLAQPDLRDAESPYGYAAPLLSGQVNWSEVARALADHGVVNVFLRNHPLADWGDQLGLPEITHSSVVSIPLHAGRDQAFISGRCATHRSQVKRAHAQGFTVAVEPAPTDLQGFRNLYESTMDRLNAADFYRFNDASWEHVQRLADRLALMTVRDVDGVTHNQALFIRGPRFAHYHLSARSADAHNAAGHLLFEAAADWASAHGCQAVHLGGGSSGSDDDGLLAYKRRIGRQDAVFRTAGMVSNTVAHVNLSARWQERTGLRGRWFQTYRQPIT